MAGEVEVVETAPVKSGAKAIEGLPDVGLVGAIATSYLVDLLDLKEVAYIDSELLPPIMVLHKGRLKSPIRIYGDDDLLVLVSEIAVPLDVLGPLVRTLADWFKSKGVSLMVSLGGIPVPNRLDIETPSVYGVANGDEAMELLRSRGIELMEEGFVAGAYALFLRESTKRELPALALLAQCFLQYPDPGAAAATITALGKLLDREFDTKPLMERAEEIRIKTRDLMRQARTAMMGMQKPREHEVPLMYT